VFSTSTAGRHNNDPKILKFYCLNLWCHHPLVGAAFFFAWSIAPNHAVWRQMSCVLWRRIVSCIYIQTFRRILLPLSPVLKTKHVTSNKKVTTLQTAMPGRGQPWARFMSFCSLVRESVNIIHVTRHTMCERNINSFQDVC
jgi:hypothetical protein